jgi:hypothetical protein
MLERKQCHAISSAKCSSQMRQLSMYVELWISTTAGCGKMKVHMACVNWRRTALQWMCGAS